jgi:hypothetical protein
MIDGSSEKAVSVSRKACSYNALTNNKSKQFQRLCIITDTPIIKTMEFNNEEFLKDRDQSKHENESPKAWRVDDDDRPQPGSLSNSSEPKPEKVERGNGENDRPHKGDTYQEGTADNDQTNIPGPNEVPDQQKVGENIDDDERDHIET